MAVQNYMRGITTTPPEFILDLGGNQEELRFTVTRLGHMTRSTVTVAGPATRRVRTFEVVDISPLN